MPKTTRSSSSSSTSGAGPSPAGGSTFGTTVIVKTGKEKDVVTAFMIIAAYLIWIIDTSPFGWLGKSYKGFIFDPSILTKINWIGITTSGIVSVFLVYDILMSLKRRESTSYIFEMMVLFFINGSTMLAYYYAAFTNPIYNFIALGIFAAIAVYLIHRHGLAAVHSSELVTYYIMVLTYSFFWTLWNWTSNIKAIIHVFFITYFMLFYLRKQEGVNANVLYMFTAFFLLADFFGYSYDLNYLVSSFKISFPIIVLLTSFYCAFFTESKFAQINAFVWTGILLFFIFAPAPAYGADVGVDVQERQGSNTWDSIVSPFIKAWEALTNKATGQLDVATGGLYSSQVEKNQYAPLGVYFDKVRAAQLRFYTDEQVTIWSTIRSKTLSDPVFIDFTCFRWINNVRVEAQKNDPNPDVKDTVVPKDKFIVFTLEDKDIECSFNQKKVVKLPDGTNTVTLSATYNFATSAYQKVYFIDKDRQRSMVRQNLDPFKEFGIKDTAPKTIFTNGPVDIAIGVTQYLIPVENDPIIKPSLNIVFKNRDKITDQQGKPFGQWKGNIKAIKELVVLLPKEIELKTEECKPIRFKDYGPADCSKSCEDFVSSPCKKACSGSGDQTKCEKGCDEAFDKCNSECEIIFTDDTGSSKYVGYQVDIDELNRQIKDQFKDIDRYKEFGCRIYPKPEILENSPITTKFIRVRARYDYLLESSHAITVVKSQTIPEDQVPIPDFYNKLRPEQYSGVYLNPANAKEIEYSPIVLKKAQEHNIDYFLVKSFIQVENAQWSEAAKGDGISKPISYGLMQIQEGTGKNCPGDWKTKAEDNINCGIIVLKDKYSLFKHDKCSSNGECPHPFKGNLCTSRQCSSSCNNNVCTYEFTGGTTSSKYYSGWEAAIRAYNGWGTGGDNSYVEKVTNNYKTLKNKITTIQPATP